MGKKVKLLDTRNFPCKLDEVEGLWRFARKPPSDSRVSVKGVITSGPLLLIGESRPMNKEVNPRLTFPGGGVERGDGSVLGTLEREIGEELGEDVLPHLDFSGAKLLHVAEVRSTRHGVKYTWLIFVGVPARMVFLPKPNHEIRNPCWMGSALSLHLRLEQSATLPDRREAITTAIDRLGIWEPLREVA